MVLEVKKGEKENPQNLIRRFTKKIQQSGILVWTRNRRFYKRIKSKNMKRKAALRRENLKQEYEKLKKLGKV